MLIATYTAARAKEPPMPRQPSPRFAPFSFLLSFFSSNIGEEHVASSKSPTVAEMFYEERLSRATEARHDAQ